MRHLFLDANIFLDFYRFGDDDLSEMSKLVALLSDGEIKLCANEHLQDEVERNRESVISGSLSELRATRYKLKSPNYCAAMPELAVLQEHLKSANKLHGVLVNAVEEKIRARDLPADRLINDILESAKKTAITSSILNRAKDRVALGNPPGKSGALGDAVHWECLLQQPHGYAQDIVSRDSDFASELEPKKIKQVLEAEWKTTFSKNADLSLFTSLNEYFRERFPDIKLSDEAQKNDLIGQLEVSPNFSTTHSLISDLSQFSFFTNGQVVRLFAALTNNPQVGWIGTDPDVKEFYIGLKEKAYWVPKDIQEKAAGYLQLESEDFFFPF